MLYASLRYTKIIRYCCGPPPCSRGGLKATRGTCSTAVYEQIATWYRILFRVADIPSHFDAAILPSMTHNSKILAIVHTLFGVIISSPNGLSGRLGWRGCERRT